MEQNKKITINKSDEATAVAEQLIDADAETVTFTVPKFSRFAESLANFKLIKREAEVLHKKVIIESIDQAALDFAKRSGLETVNPFFGETQKKFSDILVTEDMPAKKKKEDVETPVTIKPARKRSGVTRAPAAKKTKSAKAVAPVPVMIHREEGIPETENSVVSEQAPALPMLEHVTGVASIPSSAVSEIKRATERRPLFGVRNLTVTGAVLVVFGLFPYLGLAVLPRADIAIHTKKETWSFSNPISVDKAISAVDDAGVRIPGQVFIQKTNQNQKFPATGKQQIARKATGVVTIYNEFSSDPQPLVATTRFATLDGKIFRLVSGVTVPGAKIVDGKVTASSITAAVVADQAGSAYNLGPVPRLTIPGLAGSPKLETIYGELKEAAKNGFIGEAKVATDGDIKTAKAVANKAIQDSAQTLLTTKVPENFKVLPEASTFAITKQVVTPEAEADGQFSIFTEAEVSQIAFQEKDLYGLLKNRIVTEKGTGYQVDTETLNYGAAHIDEKTGRMTFPADYRATLSQTIDVQALTGQIKGKSGDALRATIAAIPGVESAQASLWPIWVRTVPQNEKKIKIVIQ